MIILACSSINLRYVFINLTIIIIDSIISSINLPLINLLTIIIIICILLL